MKVNKWKIMAITIVMVTVGVFTMNKYSAKKEPKIIDTISDKYGEVIGYDYFINEGMKKKNLNEFDKENLSRFIEYNLDIVSGIISLEDVDNNNTSIKVDLFVPKISTEPVITGTLWFNYIVKHSTQNNRGVVGGFSSDIDRKNGDSPWTFSNISMSNSDKVEVVTNFNQKDFDSLGLRFVNKFLMSDLKNKATPLDFSPAGSYEKFHSSENNWFNYAFYRFTTVRNSVPLTVVFGVKEDQYNAEETYPRNWFYVYMKRDN